MLVEKKVDEFLNELASKSPAPGGGSVAALAGAVGAALASMVCNLTIGKKKYAAVEDEIKKALEKVEPLRKRFTSLIDSDTDAFNKVMEAFSLPKESEEQKFLRTAAIESATKEATLVPLEVMKHCIDVMALAKVVAEKGNINSISDAGVSVLMLQAASEGAALNVKINLSGISDTEFVGWKQEEVESVLRTSKKLSEEILTIVHQKIS
jgi:methenyltetrahydrofolate cyclohydrolase